MTAYPESWAHRSPRARLGLWALWLGIVALFVWCWEVMTKRTIWAFVWDAPRAASDIASRAWPPRWSYMEQLWAPLWDTLNIATLGTLIGTALAVPLAFLAASNTTPSKLIARPVALLLIVASRSINSLIWALLLVSILGPGLLAGIIAIAFRSVGFVGKLLYEAIEETDARQVEAITATGASQAQILSYGIWPQVMPAFVGISVFRWDINIRESTILGLVGAGGIGMQLQSSLNMLAWPQVLLIVLVILATVIVSEGISSRVRKAII
ncbi:phosphonate ABC transporter, permease protein PhnE [Pseudogemmobacter sonorensis]|uniref:phosphonate ABC transporter, permease protein PhnE n=1 Tax=Pseudogemmobacter sonorensis TaxID=2989681 RepID=UPI00368CE77A